MSNKTKAYHHGDLRDTLIDIGVEVLAEDGMQALSLRKVARRAGVSHNAPYMHFADKEALLAAIAEAGFKTLGQEMKRAVGATSEGSVEQLSEVSRVYVTFALEHPQHFQVMFAKFADLEGAHPGLNEISLETFTLLSTTLAACQTTGVVRSGDPHMLAAGVWAMMHGLATLLIADRLSPLVVGGHARQDLPQLLFDLLHRGLRTHE